VQIEVLDWEDRGDPVENLDLDGRLLGLLGRGLPEQRLRFHRQHALDRVGIEREVEAVARADFDHLTRKALQQLSAMLVLGLVPLARHPHVDAGEEWVAGLPSHSHRPLAAETGRKEWW